MTRQDDQAGPVPWAAPQLVGRGPELAAVLAVLDVPGSLGVLLTGPTGVGKTRLATEVMARMAAAGTVVLRVIATPATAGIPLGALSAIAPRAIRTEADVVDRVVADLVAEIGGDALLLVIDDVEHLDAQSHAVVRVLLERRAARVIGTARTPGPALPSPWDGPGLVRVVLSDLDADAVAELLVVTLGGPVAAELSRQMAVATEGNPLLLHEALTVADQNGDLRRRDGIWSLAGGDRPAVHLGDLVRSRLAPLSAEDRDALELVAVADVLPVSMADSLVGPVVLAGLERQGLVRRDEVLGRGVLRPSHPIYGEALRAGLGPIARRHHARRLADATQTAPEAVVDVLRVVDWRVAAGGAVDPVLLGRAAREARRRSEFGRAEELAARAVAAGAGVTGALLLGEIQNAVGHFDEAEETFATVVRPLVADEALVVDDEHEASLLGFAALALGFNRAWGLGRGRSARQLMGQASDALARTSVGTHPVVGERRAELAADAAALAAFTGEPARAVAEADALSEHAAPRVVARAAFARAAGLIGVGRPDEAVSQSDVGLAALELLPDGFGRVSFATNLLLTRTEALADAGRLAEAERAAESTFDRAAATGFVTGQAVAAWARGRVDAMAARPVTAERWLREARLLERDLQTRGRRRWSLIGLGLALVAQGRVDDAGAVLRDLDAMDEESPVDDAFLLADETRLRASLLASVGELSSARDLLVSTAADAAEAGAVGSAAVLWHAVVLTAGVPRVVGHAAAALEGVHPQVDGLLHRSRVADAVAVLAGDVAGRLRVAADLEGAGALRLGLAVAVAALGDAEARSRRGAARTAREMIDRMTARSEGVGSATPGPHPELAALGPRQREVVVLAARGRANQDIADHLGIAVRTVENHLHRAYVELDVEGRRGLVALLGRDAPDEAQPNGQPVQRSPSAGGSPVVR